MRKIVKERSNGVLRDGKREEEILQWVYFRRVGSCWKKKRQVRRILFRIKAMVFGQSRNLFVFVYLCMRLYVIEDEEGVKKVNL